MPTLPGAARTTRGFAIAGLFAVAALIPSTLPPDAIVVTLPANMPGVVQVDPPSGPGPIRLGVTALFGLLFISGAGLVGLRWKRDQSLPLILVVLVVLFGLVAAALVPGALRTGQLSREETSDVLAGTAGDRYRSFDFREGERIDGTLANGTSGGFRSKATWNVP